MTAPSIVGPGDHRVFGFPFFTTRLPDELDRAARARFEELWELYPVAFHEMRQPRDGEDDPGATVTARVWSRLSLQRNVNRALPIVPILAPYLAWVQTAFDARLNGLLLNWYDADLAHRIGPHRDSTTGLVEGTPIVTISLGATRMFRLSPARGKGFVDFEAAHGTVIVVPWETNLHVKHSVPHRTRDTGRRISITLRAFEP